MKKTIKYYNKPKLFANDDFINRTEDQNMPDLLKSWFSIFSVFNVFILSNKDES